MADKMAVVYYKTNEKIFPETGKIPRIVYKMLILLILELHYRCNIQAMLFMYQSEFDILKMASHMVADKFYKRVGAAPYL